MENELGIPCYGALMIMRGKDTRYSGSLGSRLTRPCGLGKSAPEARHNDGRNAVPTAPVARPKASAGFCTE